MASLGFTESSCGSGPRGRLRAHSEITETFIIIEAECLPAAVWDTLTAFAVGRRRSRLNSVRENRGSWGPRGCCSVAQSYPTLWTAARQAPLSFTVSQSLLKLMSTESMMPSTHLIFCRPLLLLPSKHSGLCNGPNITNDKKAGIHVTTCLQSQTQQS